MNEYHTLALKCIDILVGTSSIDELKYYKDTIPISDEYVRKLINDEYPLKILLYLDNTDLGSKLIYTIGRPKIKKYDKLLKRFKSIPKVESEHYSEILSELSRIQNPTPINVANVYKKMIIMESLPLIKPKIDSSFTIKDTLFIELKDAVSGYNILRIKSLVDLLLHKYMIVPSDISMLDELSAIAINMDSKLIADEIQRLYMAIKKQTDIQVTYLELSHQVNNPNYNELILLKIILEEGDGKPSITTISDLIGRLITPLTELENQVLNDCIDLSADLGYDNILDLLCEI